MTVELNGMIRLFKERGVKTYLEIGARDGDTFYAVMSALPIGSKGIALDLPGGLWGKSTTAKNLISAVKALKAKGYDVNYILGDSRDKDTISHIKEMGPFDAALIDGDHTIEGVTADWENYGGLARVVAFHDIVGTGQKEKIYKNPVEVPILWADLKTKHKHFEFVDTENNSQMGIGCLLTS